MTTANLLDELEGVVCLRAKWAAEGTNAAWDELALSAVNCLFARHAEISDMAKRLEAAKRDAARYALIKKRFDDMTTGKSERFLECLGIDGDVYQPLDAAIDATQEGEG